MVENFLKKAAEHLFGEEEPENPAQMACAPEGATGHPVWEEPETHRPAVCQDRGLDRHHSESRYR